ncbi:hypothetical protein F511_22654 [Dorcoceras hygrometricum]|uniref:Uncharacterized protein n=1 Tax=Dorcoceras hygrometricum TaxID=472368 RepID=A0A2Z7BP99_9LAMI|nr:hypothetical protein F511_22654 [Dorcoceras hygrometricum]
MQVLCMRRRRTTESSTHKGAKELKHSSKNYQQHTVATGCVHSVVQQATAAKLTRSWTPSRNNETTTFPLRATGKVSQLCFVQSPESCPAASPHQESSPSSTDVSVHFDSSDVPLNAQTDTHASATVDFTMFTDSLEDLRSSIFQRIHDSNCEILSKVNAVELGVCGDLLKLQVLLRQSLENACRVLERQEEAREQDAKLIALDGHIAAIRSEQLDFQTKIAADILSLSTQVGDIADYIRGGDAKKGEIGSSSRPSTVRTQTFPPTTGTFAERAEQARRHIIESGKVISIEEAAERQQIYSAFPPQVGDIADYIRGGDAKKGEIGSSSRPSTVRTQTFPPTTGTFAERAEQARRHIIESGKVISIEEAAERVIEADRREFDMLERERERERRERRQSRSGIKEEEDTD